MTDSFGQPGFFLRFAIFIPIVFGFGKLARQECEVFGDFDCVNKVNLSLVLLTGLSRPFQNATHLQKLFCCWTTIRYHL